MRMHIGFSFNIKNILKYVILGVIALLAFFGISKVNADTLPYTSLQVNDYNHNRILFCNHSPNQACPDTDLGLSPTEYIGKYFLINFDNTILTNGHDYSFDISFVIVHDPSDYGFEEDNFEFFQLDSLYALNDTPIVWQVNTWYDWNTNRYYTFYDYSGQFTATSTSSFYARLSMLHSESFFGFSVGSDLRLIDNSTGDELIEANYQNTQNIINNQNNNTNSIINNQNNNTQQITNTINDNLQSCRDSVNLFNKNNILLTTYLNTSDNVVATDSNSISFYLKVDPRTTYTISKTISAPFIVATTSLLPTSGVSISQVHVNDSGSSITIDTNQYAEYLVFWVYHTQYSSKTYDEIINSIQVQEGSSATAYEAPNSRICSNKIDNMNTSIDDLNNTITDDSIDLSSGSDFFDDFEDENFGLSGVITAPLVAIRTLNNGSNCNDLSFVVLGKSVSLPSGCILWSRVPSSTETIYFVIVCGFLSYILVTRLFHTINNLKDPNKSEVKTLDL